MRWRKILSLRLRSLFRRNRVERELDDELRFHLEQQVAANVRGGMNHNEARVAALRAFGGVAQVAEECRDARVVGWLEDVMHDLRYSLRMLVKSPGFTIVAVLTLALGIGVNAAVFSILNGVLLRPLAFDHPEQLVKIWGKLDKQGIPQNWISEPEWWDLQEGTRSFSALAAYSAGNGGNLSLGNGTPTRVNVGVTTSSLFPLLGVNAVMGRIFTAADDHPGAQVALVSYSFWQAQLGANPNVVGSTIQLDAKPYTVVGVLPRGFSFAGDNDLWRPIGFDRAKPSGRGGHYLDVLARLKPGVTMTQAASDLDAFAARELRDYPRNYGPDRGWGMFLIPLHTEIVGDTRPALLVLAAAVMCVLLIACANLANLLLARGSARAREMAVRIAVGAARTRLVRQLLTESIVLAGLGGLAGIGLAQLILRLLHTYATSSLPRLQDIVLDWRVLLFTAAVSVLAGIIFGFAPALQLSGSRSVYERLKEAGRGMPAAAPAAQKLRSGLVVAEVSLALVLVVCAALLVRSLDKLLQVQPGFSPQHLLTARLALPAARYAKPEQRIAFFRDLLDRARSLPGVQVAGAVNILPMSGITSSGSTYVEHPEVPAPSVGGGFGFSYAEVDYRIATPGYFPAMQISLLRGRLLSDSDNESAPLVAVVDENFARRFWPTQDPIGQRICPGAAIPGTNPPQPQWYTIVGVVAHVKNYDLETQGREQAYFALPQLGPQFGTRSMTIVLRTTADPTSLTSSLRATLASMDPDEPLYDVRTMDEWLNRSLSERKLNVALLASFGGLALALAIIGIYGVVSYAVTQRTQEIGIRMALGARRSDVLRMVVGQGARLAAIGVCVGLLLAMAGTRLMSQLLYGVKPTDPLTIVVAALALPAVALLASLIPAHRATLVDPVVALRNE
ncbi:MAG TPA: ABC transporter permease [Terriglobales bacterium]|nr:ABC transporter permease [Terriglobales bacterium]